MALSDTDLHWIPMNRDKFNQLRKMFDSNGTKPAARPCDKCTSPRIRYSSAENVTALSQIRALLRPVEPDDSSTSSRSRNTSEDSVDGCTNNFNNILRDNKPSPRLPNGFVVIDPVACQKSNGFLKLNGSAEVLTSNNINNQFNCLRESEVDPLLFSDKVISDSDTVISYKTNHITDTIISQPEIKLVEIIENNNIDYTGDTKKETISELSTVDDDSDNSVDEEIRANNPFLKYVNDEAVLLSKKRQYFVNILEGGEQQITDEVTGRIMATCGKANLLLTSKFKQYRTLCTEYESKNRKMTTDDMHGFWDLIMLQVNDVNKMFEDCKVMEKNNWQPPKSPMPPKKRPVPKTETAKIRTPAKPKAKSAAQLARDEARRKMMTERKEQLKLAKLNAANNQATIEIFT